jgi:hypothetical protein
VHLQANRDSCPCGRIVDPGLARLAGATVASLTAGMQFLTALDRQAEGRACACGTGAVPALVALLGSPHLSVQARCHSERHHGLEQRDPRLTLCLLRTVMPVPIPGACACNTCAQSCTAKQVQKGNSLDHVICMRIACSSCA